MSRPKENDFTQATKKLLGERSGYRCSNPLCRKLTIGPKQGDPRKSQILGEAAHIYSASNNANAPRVNTGLTAEQLRDFDNGIWLCRNCAKLIDTDENQYPANRLKEWKADAEEDAGNKLNSTSYYEGIETDKRILSFYLDCFTRPAFQDNIFCEGSMEDLLQAFEDVLTAINTGMLKNRKGETIHKIEITERTSVYDDKKTEIPIFVGTNSIKNIQWRDTMINISGQIGAMIKKIKTAKKRGVFIYHDHMLLISDPSFATYLNTTRSEIATSLDKIVREAGVGKFVFQNFSY